MLGSAISLSLSNNFLFFFKKIQIEERYRTDVPFGHRFSTTILWNLLTLSLKDKKTRRSAKHGWALTGGLHSPILDVSLSLGNALNLTGHRQMSTLIKFMGWVASGSVCFVHSHKSCWKHKIYQFRCHSDVSVAERGDLVLFCSRHCVQSVADGARGSIHLLRLPS